MVSGVQEVQLLCVASWDSSAQVHEQPLHCQLHHYDHHLHQVPRRPAAAPCLEQALPHNLSNVFYFSVPEQRQASLNVEVASHTFVGMSLTQV